MMHFSEAIRWGCRFGARIEGELSDGRGGTCALGSAKLTLFVWEGPLSEALAKHGLPIEWPKEWLPVLGHVVTFKSYFGNELTQPVSDHVWMLNDTMHWTREAISEWVETVERKLGLWDATPSEASEAASAADSKKPVVEVEAVVSEPIVTTEPVEVNA